MLIHTKHGHITTRIILIQWLTTEVTSPESSDSTPTKETFIFYILFYFVLEGPFANTEPATNIYSDALYMLLFIVMTTDKL